MWNLVPSFLLPLSSVRLLSSFPFVSGVPPLYLECPPQNDPAREYTVSSLEGPGEPGKRTLSGAFRLLKIKLIVIGLLQKFSESDNEVVQNQGCCPWPWFLPVLTPQDIPVWCFSEKKWRVWFRANQGVGTPHTVPQRPISRTVKSRAIKSQRLTRITRDVCMRRVCRR